MSYKYLEHSTDALIEVRAPNLTKAFEIAGKSVVQTIIDDSKIDESIQKKITVEGKDLDYLLYNWLEEIIILTITDGFAIKRFKLDVKKEPFVINAELFGENIPKFDGLGMLICQAIESFNIWTSSDLIVTSIYDEVFKQLEVQHD